MPDFDDDDVAEISVDFSQFEATEDSLIPDGEYTGRVTKAVLKKKDSEDGKKKFPYIAMEVTLDDPAEGVKLFHNASLSPEGAKPFIKVTKFLLQSMGVELETSGPSKLTVGKEGVLTNPNLVGIPVKVTVGHHEYPKGSHKMQNDIARIRGMEDVPRDGASAVADARYS